MYFYLILAKDKRTTSQSLKYSSSSNSGSKNKSKSKKSDSLFKENLDGDDDVDTISYYISDEDMSVKKRMGYFNYR
jgi:hypothetical protein